MKKSLKEYLVCPKCKTEFRLDVSKEKNGEIIEGTLKCDKYHIFHITEGIPRLINEEEFEESKKQVQYSFSKKWNPNTGVTIRDREAYNQSYLDRYGFKSVKTLKDFLRGKKFILDAGTGLGRDSIHFSENCNGIIFAVDISKSINVFYANYKDNKKIHFIQGDITNLPFKENFFDYISCDQVIHHTPNPKNAFYNLLKHLKKDGELVVYTYKVKAPLREFADDHIRNTTTKLSFEDCYKVCEPITKLGKVLSDLNIEFEVPEDIPLIGIKAGRQNLQRFIYWNFLKCYWNDSLNFEDNVLVNVDWYHPLDAFRFKPEEIKNWAIKKNLNIINFDISEAGISMRVKKH